MNTFSLFHRGPQIFYLQHISLALYIKLMRFQIHEKWAAFKLLFSLEARCWGGRRAGGDSAEWQKSYYRTRSVEQNRAVLVKQKKKKKKKTNRQQTRSGGDGSGPEFLILELGWEEVKEERCERTAIWKKSSLAVAWIRTVDPTSSVDDAVWKVFEWKLHTSTATQAAANTDQWGCCTVVLSHSKAAS